MSLSTNDENKLFENVSEGLEKARSYYLNSNYRIAIVKYSTLIEQFPNEDYELAIAHYEIGLCYYLMKDYEQARKYFVIILKNFTNPRSIRPLSLHLIRKIDQLEAYKHSSY